MELTDLPVPALLLSGDRVTGANDAARACVGVDPVGQRLVEVVGASDEVAQALADPAPGVATAWHGERCFEVTAGAADAGGRLVVVRDVTEERRHTAVVNTIADTVFVVDTEGVLRWRSENGLLWTGIPHEAVVGTRHLSRLHPEDIPEALRLLNDLVDNPGQRASFTARGRSIVDPETWEHVTLRGTAAVDDPALRGVLVDVVIHEQGLRDDVLGRTAGVSIAEIAPIGIVICTRTGETVYGNPAAHELLGDRFDPVLGVSWTELLTPDDRRQAEAAIEAAANGEAPEAFVVGAAEGRASDDGARRLRVLVRGQAGPAGRADSVVCTLEDITAETAARAQAHRLESLLDASEDLVAAFDAHGTLLWANRTLQELLDEAAARTGEAPTLLAVLGADADRIVRDARHALNRDGRWTAELVLDLGEGPRTVSVIGVWDRSPDQGLSSLVIARDISRLKAVEEELRVRATHDPLTGLANRALFETELERSLARRESGTVGVLFADLDGFKEVNDRFGHASGDWLLQLVAERLLESCRPEDLVARIGGDEFAVLVHDAAPTDLDRLAGRIQRRVAEPIDWLPDLSFGVSVGIAHLETGGASTAAHALRTADAAMYEAKRRRTAPPD